MTPRFADWRERLAAFVIARRNVPFAWGAADCCLMVADAVQAMTGEDFAISLRGYRSRFGALRALRRNGFASVAAFVAARLERRKTAHAGDVIVIGDGPLHALGLCDGRGGAWGQDRGGLLRFATPPGAGVWAV